MLKSKTEMQKLSILEKNNAVLLPIVMMIIDYLAVLLAEEAALFTRFHTFENIDNMFLGQANYWFMVPMLFLLFFNGNKLYTCRTPFWQVIPKIFQGCNYAMISVIVFMYVAKVSAQNSRLFVAFLWIYSFIFVTVIRYFMKKFMEKTRIMQLPIVIVGAGLSASALVQGISDASMGYRIVGIVTDLEKLKDNFVNIPVLGKLNDIETVIKDTGVQTIVLAVSGKSQSWLNDYILRIQPLVEKIVYIPDMGTLPVGNLEAEALLDERLLLLGVNNNLSSKWNMLLKLLFDYSLAIIGIVFLWPLFLVIVWKIKQDSPGPAIYDGERIGKQGKLFKCYKFRSMYVNGDAILKQYLLDNPWEREQWEQYHKLDNDPRLTNFGKFLRSTSIDELPQLFNVLKGDMSLVGPRPYLPSEKNEMVNAIDTIVLAKPGITGYWQVHGRSEVDFKSRLEMDCWYICNWQIWMDIALLWKTVWVVLNRKGAK